MRGYIGSGWDGIQPEQLEKDSYGNYREPGLKEEGKQDACCEGSLQETQMQGKPKKGKQAKKKPVSNRANKGCRDCSMIFPEHGLLVLELQGGRQGLKP